ncbi:hypothetical protein JCGZ_00270 [Jatropha curcas]|uniref:Uncharacterized protein n=1 Tax=Jatropha curcas TaxID=180498 RepID=A0A067L5F7_JATCU|nr:hypothetical protein JCGZ_00270 [Jatropha curcas]
MVVITGIISAAVGVISLFYNFSKDAYAYFHKKVQNSRSLDDNYAELYWKVDFLLRLRSDIEHIIHRRRIISPSIVKNWNNKVWKIDGEARNLFHKYKYTQQSWVLSRAKLSRKMAKLLEKANELEKDGNEFAKLLYDYHNPNNQQIRNR